MILGYLGVWIVFLFECVVWAFGLHGVVKLLCDRFFSIMWVGFFVKFGELVVDLDGFAGCLFLGVVLYFLG